MIQRTCHHCGKTYETFTSIKPRYCSHACASKAKKRGGTGKCQVCGESFWFSPSNASQRFCSKSCARTAANLTDKNPALTRDVSGPKNPMFGVRRMGEANPMFGRRRKASPRWKGGRKVRADGYVLAIAPDDHPYPADIHRPTGLKYVLEHRLVMEASIGRYLEPEEVVHHRDGNPSNNSIENLELFACQSDHIRIGHGSANPRSPDQPQPGQCR